MRIFLRDEKGGGPCTAATQKFQDGPHWRDHILFYEYFHGDNGAGLGASHQTGWTGVIARMMHLFATVQPEELLEFGKKAFVMDETPRVDIPPPPQPGQRAPTPRTRM